MPDVRIARKTFLKGLGLAAAASVSGVAGAVTTRISTADRQNTTSANADLPMKVRPATRTVAHRAPGA